MQKCCQHLLNNPRFHKVTEMSSDCRNADGPYHWETEEDQIQGRYIFNDTEAEKLSCMFMMPVSEMVVATQEQGH